MNRIVTKLVFYSPKHKQINSSRVLKKNEKLRDLPGILRS